MYQHDIFFERIRIRKQGPVYVVSVFPAPDGSYSFDGRTPGQILADEIGRGFLTEQRTDAPYIDHFANGETRAEWMRQQSLPRAGGVSA